MNDEADRLVEQLDDETAVAQVVIDSIIRRDKAIIKLLETTTHHLVEHTNLPSPERAALLDQLREVKESFGAVQCGTGGE